VPAAGPRAPDYMLQVRPRRTLAPPQILVITHFYSDIFLQETQIVDKERKGAPRQSERVCKT
jgi:hypothetical protein